MANSKFDYSALKPVKEPSGFDPSALKPVDDESVDMAAPEEENPLLKFIRNVAAGTGQMQRRLFNTPHDLAQLAEQTAYDSPEARFLRAHLPEGIKKHLPNFNISSHLPYQPEFDFAKYFGQKGEGSFMDNVIQGGIKYAPEIASGYALLRELPITASPGIRALNKVKNEVQKRGIENLNVPKHIIEDIKNNKFLRDTQPNRNLLEKAGEGGYKDIFNLQADLGAVERGHTGDYFNAANRQFGRDVGQTRQELLSHTRKELGTQGHEDLAEKMKHGQDRFRQFMKFKPYRDALILAGLAGVPGYKLLKKLMP